MSFGKKTKKIGQPVSCRGLVLWVDSTSLWFPPKRKQSSPDPIQCVGDVQSHHFISVFACYV